MKYLLVIVAVLAGCGTEREANKPLPPVKISCWDEYKYPKDLDCTQYPKFCEAHQVTIRVCEHR